jgi:hypothetical protein
VVDAERTTGVVEDRDSAAYRASLTADNALRLAITLAVGGGDYERAAALLDVARRVHPKSATITTLSLAKDRDRK